MQFTIAAATTLLAGLAAASPAARAAAAVPRGTGYVTLELWAAAENTYTISVPLDGSEAWIGSDLSFTSISSWSPGHTVCHVHGVDGSDTVLTGTQSDVPIGPPQEQTFATCEYQH